MDFSANNLQNFKWPVAGSQKIAASPEKIWSTIAAPGNLENCHPFCDKNPVDKWPGVHARDAVFYYNGWVLQREFINWMEGVGYDLLIGSRHGGKSGVTWRLTALTENSGILTITIYPYIFQNWPAGIRWLPYFTSIKPGLRRYLTSVLKGFEWYITTGQPVKRNQFGSHKWFSPGKS